MRNVPMIIGLLLILAGCQAGRGVSYTDQVADARPEEGAVQVKILANAAAWRDTGVTVQPGKVYRVTATGSWRSHPVCRFVGPDGQNAYGGFCMAIAANRVIPEASHPTLIGRIGNGRGFVVGSSLEIRPSEAGRLFLRMNDVDGSTVNNEGEVLATIRSDGAVIASTAPSATASSKAPVPQTASRGFPSRALPLEFKASGRASDDIAVIIGNADYGKAGRDIPDVVPAYADAESFRHYAKTALGIREGNIIFIKDATTADMASLFGTESNHRGRLYNWTKPGQSRIYVYYSGHGAPAGEEGSAYLVPSNADADTIELTGYRLATLYQNLGKIPAKSVTVVLEACFSGRSEAGSLISNASPVFLSEENLEIPRNVRVISAGGPRQIASWEEDKSNSLFTKYYLTGLSGAADKAPFGNGDGKVTDGELQQYLDQTLTYWARRYYGRDQRAQFTHMN
ncbi:caspase family protein [Aestuariispira insulae]|uniref:Caspase domain-containing protein n=1 Tax=Aestuariispira insulae TaxID=1461337 RepID=A0A3D9H6P0_9PROT|nr:caspase family protein [Aestuariispira insulae]RED44811.1 caspase domain-containing protein [Aestuariispira insulae]